MREWKKGFYSVQAACITNLMLLNTVAGCFIQVLGGDAWASPGQGCFSIKRPSPDWRWHPCLSSVCYFYSLVVVSLLVRLLYSLIPLLLMPFPSEIIASIQWKHMNSGFLSWEWILIETNLWYFVCSVAQSCPTLCNPLDCSPPGSSVYGTVLAGILE